MGKLALFGALAGAGQAVVKGAELKAKEQAEVRLGDIAEARERRIAEFNSGLRTKEQGVQNEFVAGQNTQDRESRKTLSREEQVAATDRTKLELESREGEGAATRKFQGAEGAADRANRLQVANVGAGARTGAAKRFTFEKQKRSTPGTKENPLGQEYEATVVTNNDTAETYEQKGDKFFPQGVDASDPANTKTALAKDLQALMTVDDPVVVQEFLAKYHYLPAQFFRQAK